MILYFAGEGRIGNFDEVDDVLQSFYSLRKKKLSALKTIFGGRRHFLLDSGAYSALTLSQTIDIDEYIAFIKKHLSNFTVYAGLDQIGDAEGTLKNQKYMETHGLKPLPTYHQFSDTYYFEKYANEYEYIGVGGMVGTGHNVSTRRKFLDYVFGYIIKNGLKTKVHGWGMTVPDYMERYPFYSVDSTAWLSGIRYNSFKVFDNGKLRGFSASKYREKYGIDWGVLSLHDKLKINYNSYKKYVEYVTRLQKAKKMDYFNQ